MTNQRESFTLMSAGGILETIARMRESGESFDFSLNPTDFNALLIILRRVWEHDEHLADDLREWIAQFVSDIAESYNVEMV